MALYIFFVTSTRAEKSENRKDRVPQIRSTSNIDLESLADTVGIYQSKKHCWRARGASRMRAGQGIWILRQGFLDHFRPLWGIFGANGLFKDTFPFEGRGCIPLLPPSRCAPASIIVEFEMPFFSSIVLLVIDFCSFCLYIAPFCRCLVRKHICGCRKPHIQKFVIFSRALIVASISRISNQLWYCWWVFLTNVHVRIYDRPYEHTREQCPC